MNKPIQIVHSDVPITYNEQANKWFFTLRGRDRSAESLAKAKEIIDKPVPVEKAKPFEKIPAWLFKYNSLPQKVTITGIAERGDYRGDPGVWISDEKKNRSKESTRYVYPSNPKNDLIVEAIIAERKKAAAANTAAYELEHTLAKLVLPKED